MKFNLRLPATGLAPGTDSLAFPGGQGTGGGGKEMRGFPALPPYNRPVTFPTTKS